MKKIFLLLILLFSFTNCVFARELNIENSENIVDFANQMSERIKNNWNPASEDKKLSAVFKAKVDENGKFDNEIEIIKSSGSKEYDKKAQQAFLASIDKDDEFLRFYPEFTFKNSTVFRSFLGLNESEVIEYKKRLLDLSEWSSAFAFKDRDSLKGNAYVVFKTDKKGSILDSEIINANGELLENLKEIKSKVTALPSANNLATEEFWVIIVYSKYSSIPFIEVAKDKKDTQNILSIEEWKSYCLQMIESMWKVAEAKESYVIPARVIISKDGYVEEFKFFEKRLNVAAFILEKVKLPALTLEKARKNYIGMIYFENSPLLGNYITTGPVYSNINWGPYMRELENKIRSNWKPPVDNITKRVSTAFEITKNGTIENIRIVVSSGDKNADNAAIAAIKKVSPFKPLPKEYKGNSVPVEFTFDFRVPVRF